MYGNQEAVSRYEVISMAKSLNKMLKNAGFYFITSSDMSKLRPIQQVEVAISAGAKLVQYREKSLDRKQMHETTAKIREITDKAGVLFIVNDFVDVAIKANADGVHLGQDDMKKLDLRTVKLLMPGRVVGLTTTSIEEAVKAEKLGADYIFFGPLFKSEGRTDLPLGIDALKEAVGKVKIPVFAMGGISKQNLKDVLGTGCSGFVMVNSLFSHPDLKEEMKQIIKMCK
jgi:thiamine-phosphate pyrophosphorylase